MTRVDYREQGVKEMSEISGNPLKLRIFPLRTKIAIEQQTTLRIAALLR